MKKENIIRDFQTCLNEAIKAGRKPRWKPYIYVEPRVLESVLKKVCFKLNKETWHLKSVTEILFDTDSWFLHMIERKQTPNELLYYYTELDCHKMILSVLCTDEGRMQYILNNMKWFIQKQNNEHNKNKNK